MSRGSFPQSDQIGPSPDYVIITQDGEKSHDSRKRNPMTGELLRQLNDPVQLPLWSLIVGYALIGIVALLLGAWTERADQSRVERSGMTDRDGVELRPGDHVDVDGVETIVTVIGERRISVIRAGQVEIVDGATVRVLSRR